MRLDQKQKDAVYTNYGKVVVCAPPGSGKTTVIINRIWNLVQNMGADPKSILVITFTRAAALNMRERYAKISGIVDNTPCFSTFHSFFYKVLSRAENKDIDIIEQNCSIGIIKSTLEQYMDFVDDEYAVRVIGEISRFKTGHSNLENFKSKMDKSVFIKCFKCYERYKRENNKADFDDLQLQVGKLFLENRAELDYWRNLFKYILVDEFQDSDRFQIDILKLISDGNSVFAVGDEDQCIYGFRGSDPVCMIDFEKYFPGGKTLFLDVNYRSMKNIVNLSIRLIGCNEKRNDKVIKSDKSDSGEINIENFKDEYAEISHLSSKIEKLVSLNNYNYQDIAVLYRSNYEVRNIIDDFLKSNVDFRFLGEGYDFFEHFICRDIVSYLKLSLERYDRDSFSRIINRPSRYISRINIKKVWDYPVRENCFDIIKNMEGISIPQIKVVSKLKKGIKKLSKVPPLRAIDMILYRLGYYIYIEEYCKGSNLKMSQLKYIVDELKEEASKFSTILDFIEHVEKFSEKVKVAQESEKGVLLSTIHGVKGMEFKNVFIINCCEGIIPHESSMESMIEEERRLFYVGITRAIDNLYLYSTDSIRGSKKKVSRFIKEITRSV